MCSKPEMYQANLNSNELNVVLREHFAARPVTSVTLVCSQQNVTKLRVLVYSCICPSLRM
jgi:hypothetical protein